MTTMKTLQSSSYLSSGNSSYLDDLYEQFLQDPAAIEPHWRRYFEGITESKDIPHAPIREQFIHLAAQTSVNEGTGDVVLERKQAQVTQLIDAYRAYGHYHATLDPLGLAKKPHVAELDPAYYGLTPSDLGTQFN